MSLSLSPPSTPIWPADRFGQSITELPDGRKVLVAGEHEDHYDADVFVLERAHIRFQFVNLSELFIFLKYI